MGANARRRHGTEEKEPKVGTPLEDRQIHQHFDSRKGYMMPSKRQIKKRDATIELLNPPTPDTEGE